MKPRFTNQRYHALTRTDVIVVIGMLAFFILWAISEMPSPAAKARAQRLNCLSNLKQVAIAARIWAADNNNLYPMQVSVANGGAMELIATNNVAGLFDVMSNELSTRRILICPTDKKVIWQRMKTMMVILVQVSATKKLAILWEWTPTKSILSG
jgi:hypothetical protein